MSRPFDQRTTTKQTKQPSRSSSVQDLSQYPLSPNAVISEIIPQKLFMSNLEGASNLPYLQVSAYSFFRCFSSTLLFVCIRQKIGITHIVSVLKSRVDYGFETNNNCFS